MFQEGQAVTCVDEKMGIIGSILKKDKVYHVKEFISSEECAALFKEDPAQFSQKGGRMELTELPGAYWFGDRFEVR